MADAASDSDNHSLMPEVAQAGAVSGAVEEDAATTNDGDIQEPAVTSITAPCHLQLTRSTSHKVVQAPNYVRSQPIGLPRSGMTRSKTTVAFPTLVSPDDARNRDKPLPGTPVNRPLRKQHRRADSLPTVAALSSVGDDSRSSTRITISHPDAGTTATYRHSILYNRNDCQNTAADIGHLPSDPKTWRPSELAVYLAHVLKLTPKPIINDVVRFINAKHLSGKRFLRMEDVDLVDMGINISWCRIFSTARERLRIECLRAQILGTEGDIQAESTSSKIDFSSYLLAPPKGHDQDSNDASKKNSWRRTKGKSSKGRVKGIARVFDSANDLATIASAERNTEAEKRQQELSEIRKIRAGHSRTNSDASSTNEGDYLSSSDDQPSGTERATVVHTNDQLETDKGDTSDVTDFSDGEDEPAAETVAHDDLEESKTVDWSNIEPITLSAIEAEALQLDALHQVLDDEVEEAPSEEDGALVVETCHQPDLEEDCPLTPTFMLTPASDIIGHALESTEYCKGTAHTTSATGSVIIQGDLLAEESAQVGDSSATTAEDAAIQAPFAFFGGEVEHVAAAQLTGWSSEDDEDASAPDVLDLPFASNDGNIITVKRREVQWPVSSDETAELASMPKLRNARSVEDLQSVRIRSADAKPSTRTARSLRKRVRASDIFDTSVETTAATSQLKKQGGEGEGGDADSPEALISVKSRDGSMMVVSRRKMEQLQARLAEMEKQLEEQAIPAAEGYGIADQRLSRPRHARARSISFGEADSVNDPNWLSLGGWALAAGLGIGIVIGEAVLGKLRR